MKKWIYRLFFLVFGILFTLIGLSQGEFAQTWNKAIRVCLECIGIG